MKWVHTESLFGPSLLPGDVEFRPSISHSLHPAEILLLYKSTKFSMSTLALLLILLFTMLIQLSKLLAHAFVRWIPPPLHASKFASTLLTTPSAVATAITVLTADPCSLKYLQLNLQK